jgi:hypothetical protein
MQKAGMILFMPKSIEAEAQIDGLKRRAKKTHEIDVPNDTPGPGNSQGVIQ